MKTTLYSLLAAAAALGFAQAQTAYTTPVGYSTQSLLQGFNVSGLTLQTPSLAAGDFETVVGTALTDSELTFTPTAGRTYVLEIVEAANAAAVGTIQEIAAASISGTTITTPQDISGLVAAGDKYILRVAPTLEEIFTTVPLASGGVLVAALNSTNADVVWVPTGTGSYNKYFLHSGTSAFRIAGTTTPSPNIPLVYPDGLLIEKKTTAVASLTVTGEVKTVGTNSVIIQGFNLVGTVAPVGLTLRTAGLEDDLTAALNTTNADIVWLQNPVTLAYDKYFRHSGSGGTWRSFNAPTVVLDPLIDPVMPSAFLIEKKGATPSNLDLNVPSSFNSL
jgi:hypothetical protein